MSYKRRANKKIKWYPKSALERGEVENWRMMGQALLDLAVFVLFMLAAAWQYENLMEKAGGFYLGDVVLDKSKLIITSLLIIFAIDVLAVVWGRYRYAIYGIVTLICAVRGAVWAWHHMEELEMGFCQIAHIYAEWMERYYHVTIAAPTGYVQDMPAAALFILCCVSIALLLISGLCANRLIMGTLPFAVMAAGMLVGYTPATRSIAVLFMGMMLSKTGGWKLDTVYCCRDRQQKESGVLPGLMPIAIAVGMAVLIVCSVQQFGQGAAGQIADIGVHVRKLERRLEENLGNMFKGNQEENFGRVDNHAPRYKYKEVMQMELYGKPVDNQYLRGDFRTYYLDGQWLIDEEDFAQNCSKKQYDLSDMGDVISTLGGETARVLLENREPRQEVNDYSVRKCSIRYTGLTTNISYMPYYLTMPISSAEENYSADVLLKKSLDVNQTDWYLWQAPFDFGYALSVYNDRNSPVESSIRPDLPGEDWYEDYVRENYLWGSDSVPSARKVAKKIQVEIKAKNDNFKKILYARKVAAYLSTFRYSTKLKTAPEGQDVVEYFLADSHTGYCTHFATAGVLILRELGVPARYATGYIARKSTFQWAEDIEGYRASIRDDYAHAWVEIYMDKIGWVPVEMTPGYPEDPDNSVEKPSETEQKSSELQTQQETETQSTMQEPQEGDIEQTEMDKAGKDQTGRGGKSSDDSGRSKRSGGMIRLLLVLVLVVVMALTGVYFLQVHRRIASSIELEIRRKRNRRVVRRMNRRIYRKLQHFRPVKKRNLSDEAYRNSLIQVFPQIAQEDWMKFSVIVQKAYFSSEEVEDEEVKFIHAIYQQIFYKKR